MPSIQFSIKKNKKQNKNPVFLDIPRVFLEYHKVIPTYMRFF